MTSALSTAQEEQLLDALDARLERQRDTFLTRRLFGLFDEPDELRPRLRRFRAAQDAGTSAAAADHENVEASARVVLRSAGRVLLVAEAGGGATALLIRWADELATNARAELHSGAQPPRLPILLDLAERYDETRDNRSSTLSTREWVVQAAAQEYEVTRRDVDRWLTEGRTVLLLDGFHDLGSAARDSLAIELSKLVGPAGNAVVVAARPAEINSLQAPLACEAAVEVEALDPERCIAIANMLGEAGPALAHLLKSSEVLRHICHSPRGLLTAIDATLHESDAILNCGPRRAERAVFSTHLRRTLEPLTTDAQAALVTALRSAARQQRDGRRRPVTEIPDARLVSPRALAIVLRLGPMLLTIATLVMLTHTLVQWLLGPVLPWLWTPAIVAAAWSMFRLSDDATIFSRTPDQFRVVMKNQLQPGPLFLALGVAALAAPFLLLRPVGILFIAEFPLSARTWLAAASAVFGVLMLLCALIMQDRGACPVREELGGEPPGTRQWRCRAIAAEMSANFLVASVGGVIAVVVGTSMLAHLLPHLPARWSETSMNWVFDIIHGLGLGRAGPLFPGLAWVGVATLVAGGTALVTGWLSYELVLLKLQLSSRALARQGFPMDRARWLRRAYTLGLLERRGGVYSFPHPAALDAVLDLPVSRAVHAEPDPGLSRKLRPNPT